MGTCHHFEYEKRSFCSLDLALHFQHVLNRQDILNSVDEVTVVKAKTSAVIIGFYVGNIVINHTVSSRLVKLPKESLQFEGKVRSPHLRSALFKIASYVGL